MMQTPLPDLPALNESTMVTPKIIIGKQSGHRQRLLTILLMTIMFIFWTILLSSKLAWTNNPAPEEICNEEADRPLLSGEWQTAIELHQKLIEKSPGLALAHYHLGVAYGQIDQHDQEASEYRKAIFLGLKKADLYYNLGIVLGESVHDYPGAIAAFKEAIKLKPTDAEFHYNLGFAYLLNKEEGPAEKEFRKTLRIEPKHLQARISLGSLYADRKEFAKAQREWEKILRIDPSNSEALANLQWLKQQGEYHTR